MTGLLFDMCSIKGASALGVFYFPPFLLYVLGNHATAIHIYVACGRLHSPASQLFLFLSCFQKVSLVSFSSLVYT